MSLSNVNIKDINPSGTTNFLQKINLYLIFVENMLVTISAIMILTSMVITCIDVFMRYFLKSPLNWAYDFIVMYLLPGSYFLAFSFGLRIGVHLSVEFLAQKLRSKYHTITVNLFLFLGFIVFITIGLIAGLETYESWQNEYVVSGIVPWPIWPTKFIVFISTFIFSLRLLMRVIKAERTYV